jgi:hypothetical protein
MTVTGTREGSMMLRRSDSVSGYYTLGGERRHVDSSWWWTPEPLPTEGETIRVCVGPPWPHQVIQSSTAAGFLVAAGLVAARDLGADVLRLDTRHDLVEARALYAECGYTEIAPYSNSPYAEHWFEKKLVG